MLTSAMLIGHYSHWVIFQRLHAPTEEMTSTPEHSSPKRELPTYKFDMEPLPVHVPTGANMELFKMIGSCTSTYLLSQVCYQIPHIDEREREKRKSHQRNAKAKGPAELKDR